MATKKCMICDHEFDTPGIRCKKCRALAIAPKHMRIWNQVDKESPEEVMAYFEKFKKAESKRVM